MDHIGIDAHKKESQVCMFADGGELIECRIRTEPGALLAALDATFWDSPHTVRYALSEHGMASPRSTLTEWPGRRGRASRKRASGWRF